MNKQQLRQEMFSEAQHEAHMAFLTKQKMNYLKEKTPLFARLFSKKYKTEMDKLFTRYSFYLHHSQLLFDKL